MGETALSASGKVLPVFAGVGSSGTAVTVKGRPPIAGEAAVYPIPGAVVTTVAVERRPVVMGETAFTATGKVLPVFPGVGSSGTAVTVKGRPPIAGEAAVYPIPGAVVTTVAVERRPVVMGETAFTATGKVLPVFAGVGPSGAAVVAEGRFVITGGTAICPVLRTVVAAVTMERWPVVMGETAFTASGEISPAFTLV